MTPPAERRASVRFAGIVAAVIVAVIGAQLAAGEYTQFFIDVKVPYCAGSAMLHGLDPYRFGSLPACEHAVAVPPFVPALRAGDPALPLPIPPYEMLPFLVLAQFPFPVALALWMGLNIGCCTVAADLLRRMLPSVHPALIGTAVIVSAVPVGLDLGQFAGFVLLAVTAMGMALRRGQPVRLGLWLPVATIQPHVALPAAVALLFGGGRAVRLAVLGVGLAIGLLSALAFGPLTVEWLTQVLPGHAGANLIDAVQVSFVSGLATLGLPLGLTSLLSKLIYAAAIVFGAVAATRIARRSGRAEALPWIGAAIGTLGAPYLHLQQITFVLPAALLLVDLGPARRWAECALYGLAIPWAALVMQSWGPWFALGAGAGAWRRPTPRGILATAATAVLLLAILTAAAVAFDMLRRPEPAFVPPMLAPDAFGEDAWAPFIVIQAHAFGLATLPARVLTWSGGLLLIVLTARAAFARPSPVRPAAAAER